MRQPREVPSGRELPAPGARSRRSGRAAILSASPHLLAEIRKAMGDGRAPRLPPVKAFRRGSPAAPTLAPALRPHRIASARTLGSGPQSARLTAVVGHELRAPLATALMYMAIVERQIAAGAGDASVRSSLAVAREEILRIERLIVRVTELQRLGHPVIVPRFVDLGQVVRGTVQRALMGDSAAQVQVVVAPGGLEGWWDDAAVEQILQNLLSNALKFGAGRPVRVIVSPSAFGVRLLVRDKGVGIGPADLEKIFRCRVRAPVERSGGLGLGLWLARALADAHGGRLSVQSRLGQGSTFTVALRELPPSAAVRPAPIRLSGG